MMDLGEDAHDVVGADGAAETMGVAMADDGVAAQRRSLEAPTTARQRRVTSGQWKTTPLNHMHRV
jgi:hypothetical protein